MGNKTIHLTKRNTFIKGENGNGEVFANTVDAEGTIVKSKPYKANHSPGAFQLMYPRFDHKTRRYDVGMDQDELNKLVIEMDLRDNDGNKITEAPLNTNKHPFWSLPEIAITIDKGMDGYDDDTPIGKFKDKWTSRDRRFNSVSDGRSNPLMNKMSPFTKAGEFEDINEVDINDSEKAMEYLYNMDHPRKKQMLELMGVVVQDNASEKVVHKQLFRKITEEKNDIGPGGKSNLQIFLSNANATRTDIVLELKIQEAVQRGLIRKMENNDYRYGPVTLGGSMAQSIGFLKKPENTKILNQIVSDLGKDESNDQGKNQEALKEVLGLEEDDDTPITSREINLDEDSDMEEEDELIGQEMEDKQESKATEEKPKTGRGRKKKEDEQG